MKLVTMKTHCGQNAELFIVKVGFMRGSHAFKDELFSRKKKIVLKRNLRISWCLILFEFFLQNVTKRNIRPYLLPQAQIHTQIPLLLSTLGVNLQRRRFCKCSCEVNFIVM